MATNLKVYLTANTEKFNKAMRKAQLRIKKFSKSVSRVANKAGKAFLFLGGIVAFKLTKSFIAFDKAMTNSLAIMDNVSSRMRKQMEDLAKEISGKVTFSAKELAESYFFLASAGLNAMESMATLGTVAKFAQAGLFDMSEATRLLVGSVKALGKANGDANETLEETKKISDILVKANTLANAKVEEFAQSLGAEAAASMDVFNIRAEEGVAVLAAMADKMITGEKAGMLFSRFIKRLIPSANKNAEAFKKLGIEIFDANDNLKPMADVLQEVSDGLEGLSPRAKSAALEALGFKVKMQGAILPILNSADAVRKYTKELENSTGFTERVASKQLKSFSAQWQLFANKITNQFMGASKVVTAEVFKIVKSFNDMDKPMQSAVMNITAWSVAFLAIIPVIFKLVAITKALIGFTTAHSAALMLDTGMQWASISALRTKIINVSTLTKLTKLQAVASIARWKAGVLVNAGMLKMKTVGISAMKGLGVAALAVGVAFAAWKIGRKIAEITGLDKALTKFYKNTFFGAKKLEKEGRRLDEELKKLLAKEKIQKKINKTARPKKIKEDFATTTAREGFEALQEKARFKKLTDLKKINEFEKQRLKLLDEIKFATGAEKFTQMAKEITISEKIHDLQEKINDKEKDNLKNRQSLTERLTETLERGLFKFMSADQKINNLLEKRQKLINQISESTDKTKTLELKIKLAEGENVLSDLKNRKTGQKRNLAGAMQKGSVEAYRAEISRNKKGPENKTAENTKKSVEIQKQMLNELQNKTTMGGNVLPPYPIG